MTGHPDESMDKRDSVLAAVLKVLERFWGPQCQYHPDVDAGGGMFWRGVTLRPDAFDALGLPLAVRSGSIARLHISAGPGGEEEALDLGRTASQQSTASAPLLANLCQQIKH